jgi:hypothetical protein
MPEERKRRNAQTYKRNLKYRAKFTKEEWSAIRRSESMRRAERKAAATGKSTSRRKSEKDWQPSSALSKRLNK